ncbi:hypothetical protein AQS8620_01337 [Aquimixticola soesokkakensis]|uniref:Phage integrase family protein n=1 Tax=Aquimixticola soesokkakensis TaxID=1519096 RepID=A0A1Y5SBL3_9RHOB|nr:hypothetical protein [Aquimixticola soesokkakensis]SLN37009.1 hypothetical protein AQS8620_01337 [Aquimixticola soesokkakensis]
MTAYKPALWDGSDPSYAPGLSWSKRNATWKAPKKYSEAGFEPARVNLNLSGTRDDEHQLARAELCRAHTRAMLEWWDKLDKAEWDTGSFGYLIHRYLTDPESPYAEVKANTQKGYAYCCDYWNGAIGNVKITALDYRELKRIQKAMQDKGRSVAFIHRMITNMRILASYGKILKLAGAADLKETLSEMRFQSPSGSTTRPTRAQIEAVIAVSDRDGNAAFSAGLMLQFELSLRAVDVRGQWFPIDEAAFGNGGIVRRSVRTVHSGLKKGDRTVIFTRWQDGLRIEHFDADMTSFVKVISKTEKSMPEPIRFSLEHLPDLRTRLIALRGDRVMGPLIVTEAHGLPFERSAYAACWRRYAALANVPSQIKLKDARAGGLTEAESYGADPRLLQAAGQHANFTTTERYLRNKDEQVNKVVELRQAGRNRNV